VPGLGHHDDLRADGLRDPGRLPRRIAEVGILLAHHDQGGGGDLGQPCLR
jgi:hypothetical protein